MLTEVPLTLPTEVLVSSPPPPLKPLRSTTSQVKNAIAVTRISGLAMLRKNCIMRGNRSGLAKGMKP